MTQIDEVMMQKWILNWSAITIFALLPVYSQAVFVYSAKTQIAGKWLQTKEGIADKQGDNDVSCKACLEGRGYST